MGLFQQGQQESKGDWAGLPSEPFDRNRTEQLDEAPSSDALGLGLGLGASVSSVELPADLGAAAPAPHGDHGEDSAPTDTDGTSPDTER